MSSSSSGLAVQEGGRGPSDGSVNDASEEPLCLRGRVRANCPCHGCSPAKKSNLYFVFPSALKRFRRCFPVRLDAMSAA